jgi:hypothetical protein
MHQHKQKYIDSGYREIKTDSGTGSYVLVHKKKKMVVKFGQDPAYDKFVDFIINNPSSHYPKVFCHDKPRGDFSSTSNEAYTITELELLKPLNKTEQNYFVIWMEHIKSNLQSGNGFMALTIDYFLLNNTIADLFQEAAKVSVNIDLNKSTNIMVRVKGKMREYVITDGFN